jgi:hypothetical protein
VQHHRVNVLFSDEAVFYGNGEVNQQNTRYWSQYTPHRYSDPQEQGATRLMLWCGTWKDRIIGPFFFNKHVNAHAYLRMLEEEAFGSVLNGDGEFPTWFQQDGAPVHYSIQVREFVDQQFPGHWIGRRGPV